MLNRKCIISTAGTTILGLGLVGKSIVDGVISGTGEALSQWRNNGKINLLAVGKETVKGGILSFVSGKITEPVTRMKDKGHSLIDKGLSRVQKGSTSARKSARGAIKRGFSSIDEGSSLVRKGTAITYGVDVTSSMISSYTGPTNKKPVWCYPGTYVYM